MELILLSFFAGVLTVLAPCVIPLLPIILGSSAANRSWKKPVTIIVSLAFSIFLITALIKASTSIIDISDSTLETVTAIALVIFGLITIFPDLWTKLQVKLGLGAKSDQLLHESSQKEGLIGDMLVGFSLGPVFNSCSPTYLIFILPLLREDFIDGMGYFLLYLLGLVWVLSIVALLGTKFTKNVKWAYDPESRFRKGLGVMFLVLGVIIFFGLHKEFEAYLLENSDFYIELTNFEGELVIDARE